MEISIHAAREGGDKWGPKSQAGFDISIHAAREGGDVQRSAQCYLSFISIHAAREGGDKVQINGVTVLNDFNPRRP